MTTRIDPAVSGSARYEAGPEKSKAAEISDRDAAASLQTDLEARTAAQQVLLAQNVRAVIARAWPSQMNDRGWRRIDGTDYFYHLVTDRP